MFQVEIFYDAFDTMIQKDLQTNSNGLECNCNDSMSQNNETQNFDFTLEFKDEEVSSQKTAEPEHEESCSSSESFQLNDEKLKKNKSVDFQSETEIYYIPTRKENIAFFRSVCNKSMLINSKIDRTPKPIKMMRIKLKKCNRRIMTYCIRISNFLNGIIRR